MPELVFRDVSKSFGDHQVIRPFSATVPDGEFLVLLGPSGCGKSTLLRMIAGLTDITSGELLFQGERANDWDPKQRGVAFVFQSYALYPHMSVRANIAFPLVMDAFRKWHHIPGVGALVRRRLTRSPAIASRTGHIARQLELETLLDRRPASLSGGQRQRVALARALARRPKLMLLDEPFSALDTGLRASTRQAVAELLSAEGITTILVTHDQAEALSFADQVVVMREGRLLQAGTPEEVYLRSRDATVARFLGPAILLPARCAGSEVLCPLGALRVHPGARPGEATVMLREEQIELEPAVPGAGMAVVERTAFGGSQTSLWLRLKSDGTVITLRASPFRVPRAGDEVSLRVLGEAHLLPSED